MMPSSSDQAQLFDNFRMVVSVVSPIPKFWGKFFFFYMHDTYIVRNALESPH